MAGEIKRWGDVKQGDIGQLVGVVWRDNKQFYTALSGPQEPHTAGDALNRV